jgi:ureidoglycolate lyase
MVRVRPITAAAFAPYGDLVSAGVRDGRAANQGTAVRFDHAAALESTRAGARPNLAVFRSTPKALPFRVRLLERHPCSTQAFLPLVCASFLVVVAPGDDAPDAARIEAFLCGPGQGINYRRGVWHHPIVALEEEAEFAMLAWEDGGPDDCVERWLDVPVEVGP